MLATFFVTLGFADEPDVNLHKKCLYPTVHVTSKDRMGSGVIIKSVYVEEHKQWLNTVLSSAHVLVPDQMIFDFDTFTFKEIKTPPYKIKIVKYKDWSHIEKTEEFDCHIRRRDYGKDICVLNFWTKEEMPIAELNLDEKLYIGNDLMRIGAGLGDEIRVDYGRITGFNSKIQSDCIRTSVQCVPGDSGGPVFHNYKLIGIVKSIRYMATEEKVRVPVHGISYILPIKEFTKDDLCIEEPKVEEPKKD